MDEIQPPSSMKILIIRLSSIGDIVLTTPVIRAVKEQFPNASLHFLVKKSMKDVLAYNPHIDRLHLYDQNTKEELLRELAAEKFDTVVDLQNNHRSRQLCRRIKISPLRLRKVNFKKWVCVRLKVNFMPDVHIVNRYFDTVRMLSVYNDHKGLEFHIPASGVFDEDDFPMVFEDGFVAIVMAGAHATKRIPADKVIEIGRILRKPVMLLGGEDVQKAAQEVEDALGDRAYNGCGKYTLYQTASILQQADCIITGDTGLMHIAAAFQKPIAVLWGNTIPEFGMYPYMPGLRTSFRNFEVVPLHCRPCSKLGYKKCPRKHFKCMRKISSVEVAEWVNKF